jgi:hypothetical protein
MIANWYFIHSSIFSRKALKFDIMEENATHNIFSKTANLCWFLQNFLFTPHVDKIRTQVKH